MSPHRGAYRLVDTPPGVQDYLALRERAGLTPRSVAQATRGLEGAWAACHVLHEPTGEVVAMGRVIGDGGWYFHVIDMAVLPGHQRRGLGARVLDRLIERVVADAPDGATINLLADPPGRALYRSRGFVETSPGSEGMVLRR